MAKKDVTTHLNIEHQGENPRGPVRERPAPGKERKERTEVKNAHATGLGAIGRNDQKLDKPEDFNSY